MAEENNFYFETLCEYKQPDGTGGWILTVKLPNQKMTNKPIHIFGDSFRFVSRF